MRVIASLSGTACEGTGQERQPVMASGRTLDARPDTLDFRDRMFEPTLIRVPQELDYRLYLKRAVPVLDQGKEGACTGFGLATVANALLSELQEGPLGPEDQVSPRMLYEMARRYDEWPGEDYAGSSARGAMKGWHRHGVCDRGLWPNEARDVPLTDERAEDARRRPLGAYYRVNHQDIVAMHSAIAEVGVLYATAMVHDGWDAVGRDGLIRFHDVPRGAHAFAIVGYDREGLWIQNSWGPDWGREGLARIGYDDWLLHGTDVWVARFGVPIALRRPKAVAVSTAPAGADAESYAYAELRPHLISLGNDGRLRSHGTYGTGEADVKAIIDEDLPRLTRRWATPRPAGVWPVCVPRRRQRHDARRPHQGGAGLLGHRDAPSPEMAAIVAGVDEGGAPRGGPSCRTRSA